MFYYYFKSKQDIYLAAMEQYIDQRLERKCRLLEDPAVPFEEKLPVFRSMVEQDLQGYLERFAPRADASISDVSYRLYDLTRMLDRMVVPYSRFLLQGIRENRIENRFSITEDNAEAFATFVLYGAWGTIYNGRLAGGAAACDLEDLLEITDRLFH